MEYIGNSAENYYNSIDPRYFYGLRRTADGELYLGKIDQAKKTDILEIHKPGSPDGNYPNFQKGVDFHDGRSTDHEIVYENLNYEQYRWDAINATYYIDDEGQLILRTNQNYIHPDGI